MKNRKQKYVRWAAVCVTCLCVFCGFALPFVGARFDDRNMDQLQYTDISPVSLQYSSTLQDTMELMRHANFLYTSEDVMESGADEILEAAKEFWALFSEMEPYFDLSLSAGICQIHPCMAITYTAEQVSSSTATALVWMITFSFRSEREVKIAVDDRTRKVVGFYSACYANEMISKKIPAQETKASEDTIANLGTIVGETLKAYYLDANMECTVEKQKYFGSSGLITYSLENTQINLYLDENNIQFNL